MKSLFLIGVLVALPAAPAHTAAEDYQSLQQGRYSTTAIPVPAEGVSFSRGVAAWTLESGHVRLQEPLADGTITGLVFEGRGRFHMTIPDPVERAQWRRAAERPDDDEVDETFSALVLRTSEDFLAELFDTSQVVSYDTDKTARDRHDTWFRFRFDDVDARVICGLRMPGDRYLRVEMKTDAFDWLTYEYDGLRLEEILLFRFFPKNGFVEEWVSLDRPEDRDEHGRPSRDRRPVFDLRNVDMKIDITRAGKRPQVGLSDVYPRRVHFAAELALEPLVDGAEVLPLILSPWSEVIAVTTADGEPLTFFRDHVGKRSSILDNDLYVGSLLVVLDRPLVRGEERRVVVEYERELLNYASGRSWYPGEDDSFRDVHTATLEITARKKDDVRAMGRLVEEREDDGGQVRVWKVERPAKMVTFSFAERFHEEKLQQDGTPEVIAFAAASGVTIKSKTYNVAADVINSLMYFQQLFDSRLPAERLYVTSIIGSHGQSFDGFIHLSERSFNSETRGPTQLFRAHEVAHQWWGHDVVWSGYRDQWLSEAFAEYSAMMFVQNTMEKGQAYYDEIVEAYSGQMLGVVQPNRFRRFPLESNDRQRERIGPISIGYRASTGTSTRGYTAQTYFKGAVVLHMLRTLLRNMTNTDDTFVLLLRDFLANHHKSEASTADFLAALNRRVPLQGGWDWFFDQWVHDTAIPTYRWRYDVAKKRNAEGNYLLQLEVEQSDVPAGFRMPVPVRIEFGKEAAGQILMMVDEPKSSLTVPVPKKPKNVVFNPDGGVLARVKKI